MMVSDWIRFWTSLTNSSASATILLLFILAVIAIVFYRITNWIRRDFSIGRLFILTVLLLGMTLQLELGQNKDGENIMLQAFMLAAAAGIGRCLYVWLVEWPN